MERKENKSMTLGREIQSVKDYLQGKTLEYGDKLSWDFKLDPEAQTGIQIPSDLIKSFVEHAFLNGNHQQTGIATIDISIHRTTLGILIMITDNGSLRYQEYSRERMIGNRLELLDQEIHEFNLEQDHSVNYQLMDLAYVEPGQKGTRVLITIVL